MAIVQRELVENRRWLSNEEFIEEWAVAQVMPGPNVVNLALMVGGRYFGLAGALSALAGILVAPLIVVLILAMLHVAFIDHPGVSGALKGMGAVAAGLIGGAGLKVAGALKFNVMPFWFCLLMMLACFVAIGMLRLPLGYVLLGLGSISCSLAYRRVKR